MQKITPGMSFRKSLNTYASCVLQVVLSGDGGAAKWFIESLQNEEASLLVVRTHLQFAIEHTH